MSGDWADRAGTVEDVIRRRFVPDWPGWCPGPDRAGALAPPATDPPVAVALLVAGPPAGLPGRRPAPRTTAVPGDGDRRTGPNSPRAQLRVLDQRLLRRHRLVRPGSTASRTTGTPLHDLRARRDHLPAPRRLGTRKAAAASGGAAATISKTPPPTVRPRSWPPARATWSSPPKSSTGSRQPCLTRKPAWSVTGSDSTRTGRSGPWKRRPTRTVKACTWGPAW